MTPLTFSHRAQFLLTALIPLLFLAACGITPPMAAASITSIPTGTATVLQTQTPSPINTSTAIPTETNTPTATYWFQPKTLSLATLSPTLFPLLSTPYEQQESSPTPIDTPSGSEQAYRLKPWSESAGIALINRLVDYAHAADFPGIERSGFTEAQSPIRLASLEYLLRYPNTANQRTVRWRLALSDALLIRPDSDRWVLSQIEQGLNDGTIDPGNINATLLPYGFSVDTNICPMTVDSCYRFVPSPAGPLITSSLFGDDGKTQIILVDTIEPLLTSENMIAALHQDPHGRFYVIPLYSGPSAEFHIAVQDLTGDGLPEVWVDDHGGDGAFSYEVTFIYHWVGTLSKGGRFVEVTNRQIVGSDEARPNSYTLTPGGEKGQPGTLDFIKPEWGLGFSDETIFRWNGFYFVASDLKIPFPNDPYITFQGPLGIAMDDGQFQQISDFLKQPLDPAVIKEIGPALPDYVAFQKALTAALQFKVSEAQATMKTLLSGPVYPNGQLPKIVAAYLSNYHQETDVYRACQSALTEFDHVISNYSQAAQRQLGYQMDNDPDVCSLEAAFRQLVKKLNWSQPDKIPAQLAQYGIYPAFKTELDADGDGKPDWLMTIRLSDSTFTWLLQSGQTSPVLIHSDYYASGPLIFRFETIQLPGSDRPAYLLKAADRLIVFRFYPGDGGTAVETLLDEAKVNDYQIISSADSIDLLISKDPKEGSTQERLHWDASQASFLTYPAQEQELLLQGHSSDVIRAIPALLTLINHSVLDPFSLYPYDPHEEQARLRYLLGLAYELSGDSQNAVRTYYNLWYSYPDQAYGVMAREKIEPLSP